MEPQSRRYSPHVPVSDGHMPSGEHTAGGGDMCWRTHTEEHHTYMKRVRGETRELMTVDSGIGTSRAKSGSQFPRVLWAEQQWEVDYISAENF